MTVPDAHYTDPELAALYDEMCAGRPDFPFYLPLVLGAPRVLDVGCGTGELLRLARAAGHTGHLVGLDPAAGMLGVARSAGPDIDWVHATLPEAAAGRALGPFDLIVMTGHAFQVLLADEELHAFFRAIRTLIAPTGNQSPNPAPNPSPEHAPRPAPGRFVFETRNPAARGWEQWPGMHSLSHTPDGAPVYETTTDVAADGEFVSFSQVYTTAAWPEPRASHSVLRFLGPGRLDAFLAAAGLAPAARYGDWHGGPFDPAASREIITVAVPA